MNHKYAVKLKLDVSPVNKDLDPVTLLKSIPAWADNVINNPQLARHFTLPRIHWSPELIHFFDIHEQYITYVEVFYTFPNKGCGIHVDDTEPGDFTKINWVYLGKDSKMKWYEMNVKKEFEVSPSITNSSYIEFQPKDVNLVHSENLQGPNIVQVGCPHAIENSIEERFCISVVFKNTKTTNFHNRPTMKESLEIFKDYIVGDP